MDIVEVFWDARPALRAINAKVGGGDLSEDVQALFAVARGAVAEALPGAVALTRIVTHPKATDEGVRVRRNGAAVPPEEAEAVARAVHDAVDAHVRAHQEARLLASTMASA
ncbi:hypothetical protein NK718_07285 [Alsobacter sp. SYSU M60028]|uniref:Uncharacterized protein n=1 Tax=Alsobacter ponti TaxID=2962936 RepID=A0ABT1LDK5_9HYPH|nr:hypothetical protein [Alsobacter ponti]MCP8938313.1 hypothetical protein [Alsobacter ponti]